MISLPRRLWAVWLAMGGLAFGPGLSTAAQADGCPVVNDAVVSAALGAQVHGTAQAGTPAGFDLCDFQDPSGTAYGVAREAGPFVDGAPVSAAVLAQRYIPSLSDDARAQIEALNEIGIPMASPGYQITVLDGIGDSAIWVTSELLPGVLEDSVIVQRGRDALSFTTSDAPEAQAKLTSLARAALQAQSPP